MSALLASGCSSTATVESAEGALARGFLEPLEASQLAVTVVDTCHLDLPSLPDEPWHLEVEVLVEADHDRVADVLQAAGAVLVRDREPMAVQQEPGQPATGWNGVLARVADGAVLGLTFNNVMPGRLAEAGGWAELCHAG